MVSGSNQSLIVTGGTEFSFFIYDLESRILSYKKEKQTQLESSIPDSGRPSFRPFGVCVEDDQIYLASNDRIGTFNKQSCEFLGLLDIPAFVNTHQIAKHKDTLFVCHTAANAIGIHNLKTNTNQFLDLPSLKIVDSINAPSKVYEYDIVHVNSIFIHEDKLYFCLHNKGKSESNFGVLNLETLRAEYMFNGGLSCHDIQIFNGFLYSLSTADGRIIKHDLKIGQTQYCEIADPQEIFLRGLQVYNEQLLIGCSNTSTCFIAKLDPVTLEMEEYIKTPEIDQITDFCLYK